MEPVDVGKYLIVHPGICHGQLTFKGTRVPVETVLYFLSTDRTIDRILEGWPELTREAVAEAILLARDALVERPTPAKGRRVSQLVLDDQPGAWAVQ